MQIEIVVPEMGESISEGTVSSWLKAQGDAVAEGDVLVELETDKVMVEVPAPEGGLLKEIRKEEGEAVGVGEILGLIDTEGAAGAGAGSGNGAGSVQEKQDSAPTPAQGTPQETSQETQASAQAGPPAPRGGAQSQAMGPAARRLAEEQGVDPARVTGSGPRGQVTKADVAAQAAGKSSSAPAGEPSRETAAASPPMSPPLPSRAQGETREREERVKMNRLRQRIAERLVEAQQTAAILTTFNEVDMTEVMAVRGRYKEIFREKYGIAIGFMSFFTKACIEALKAFPAVNAELSGDEIVYKNYYDIAVAVGTERGLVVPVVREADRRSFIEVEMEIAALAKKARDNKLSMDDLTGGTFTISNGGIYGSMLSTPIINPPQVGILGMHNIVQRPMVVDGEIKARPMMFLALSYDHRIIDGREAVQFLIRVKECIEDPARILLEI